MSACTRSAGSRARSAMQMGVDAIFAAVADAGVEWKRHQRRDRRQLDGGQSRRHRRHGRAVRHPVHQRVQRLRHRGQRGQGVRRRNPVGRLRHRHRRRPGQAPARRVHRGSRPGRHAELVRRERPVPDHPVLRHEGQPLPARARHLATRRWPRWSTRTSATAR